RSAPRSRWTARACRCARWTAPGSRPLGCWRWSPRRRWPMPAWSLAAPPRAQARSALEYRLEAAPDHPLAVEGHVHVRHGGVVLHLFPGGVGGRLVRPDEPGEDHLLAVLELDRALEVGGLAVLDLLAPGLHLLQRAVALEQGPGLLRGLEASARKQPPGPVQQHGR